MAEGTPATAGPGVMVYWHVERKQLCIYSQLTTCSASEVAAMLQGLLHHDTDAEIETNITATTASTINSHPSWTDKRGSGHPLRVSRGGWIFASRFSAATRGPRSLQRK